MKKIFAFAFLVMTAVSCSFVQEKSYTKVGMDEYITSPETAEPVLYGIYKVMTSPYLYGEYLSMLYDLPNDEAKVRGNSIQGLRTEASNAATTTSTFYQNTWQQLYVGVYRANSFLEQMDEALPSFSEVEKAEGLIQIAEAKCLRALFYFELVRWFGNIPLMKTTAQSEIHPSKLVQAAPEDVYAFIEQDLTEAAAVLPYAVDDNVRSSNAFRFSKGAALGLLARVYVTWAGYPICDTSKWQKAADTAAEVVNSGKHSLLPEFVTLWKNTANNVWAPEESLIEVSFYTNSGSQTTTGMVGKFNGVYAPTGSIRSNYAGGYVTPQPSFIWYWENRDEDLRCHISYADYYYKSGVGRIPLTTAVIDDHTVDVTYEMAMDNTYPGWNTNWRRVFVDYTFPAKWDTEVYTSDDFIFENVNYSNTNWYIMRYADLLLLYAEALNEVNGGPTAEAYDAVNQVRRRGYGYEVTYDSPIDLFSLDQDEFRTAIRKERSYELAFEGQRKQDLIRWGIYYETIVETFNKSSEWHENYPLYCPYIEYTRKGKSEILPIPQREMDLCTKFIQNDGWK